MKKFDYYGGAFLSSIALAAAVVVAELFPPFKDSLKAIFWHHWVGKVAIVIAAFVIGGFYLKKSDKAAWYAAWGSLLAILAFFVLHYNL